MDCSICAHNFKSSDEDIYSTTCGHIFHFACINEWRKRSRTCPLCSSHGEIHRIYLSFDEAPQRGKETNLEFVNNEENIVKICNYMPSEILQPGVQHILDIAKSLTLNIFAADIVGVRKLSPSIIIAEFRTPYIKKIFLQSSRRNLRNVVDPTIRKLHVKDYIGRELYKVFKYANERLRVKDFGYSMIFCNHNQITARMNKKDETCVVIKNKEDVDELVTEIEWRKMDFDETPKLVIFDSYVSWRLFIITFALCLFTVFYVKYTTKIK